MKTVSYIPQIRSYNMLNLRPVTTKVISTNLTELLMNIKINNARDVTVLIKKKNKKVMFIRYETNLVENFETQSILLSCGDSYTQCNLKTKTSVSWTWKILGLNPMSVCIWHFLVTGTPSWFCEISWRSQTETILLYFSVLFKVILLLKS